MAGDGTDGNGDGTGPPGIKSPLGPGATLGTTWTLTLPGGRTLTVTFEQVATYACDHARESHAYQPNDSLRHLVQVRDGTCTFPSCSRHARDTDFEHALPYDQGGRTCACNAGARSRKCHRVKQSPGWNVTQPKPGWHQWSAAERPDLHARTQAVSGLTAHPATLTRQRLTRQRLTRAHPC